jgi:ubiquinone/menaquinone biosynthesis C-methylase UbiE
MTDEAAAQKAQTRTQFNALAPDYDSGPGCFAHFGRRLVDAAGVAPGQRVLDIASGRGAVLLPAAERVGNAGAVVGIDLAEEMARLTNDAAARRGLNAHVRVMDAERLDFPDASYDRVLCGFGIMFFPDQPRALGEARRVLKSGGRIGVSTWHQTQNHELEAVLAGFGVTMPRQPGWITEADALSRLLMHAGFADVHVATEAQRFRYADADEYWRQAHGTGMRRALDALDAATTERVRAALTERLRAIGFTSTASALIATASR